MIIDKVVNLKANYIVTKCDIHTIAALLIKYLNLPAVLISNIILGLQSDKDNHYKKSRVEATKNELFRKKYLGKYQYETHNLVPLVLRKELATLIAGSTVSPSFQANVVALGSNSAAPTNADTQLGTETKRAAFTNRYAIDNTAYLDKFFGSVEVAGNTYLECGVFVDGNPSVANSGYLLSHVNIDQSISVNESLTLNITITVS